MRCFDEVAGWDSPDVATGNPLNYAVSECNIPAAEALLKYSVDSSKSLHVAITFKHYPAVKLLLKLSANDPGSLGIAITQDYLKGAKLCLQYGADAAHGELHDKQLTDDSGV